ncbi:MAG: class I SAM-dependent methyltransferase [Anaerolineae bacterium]|nr:class I SAM-dependent methyltransferase [Anaerolineae bacterium]MCO5187601.1 class I SAM-dependent methyltransferase [Anaerolineae bacterium]MCO5204981.1 class I SAM-dependent methyltransferase [Anaerolineae bacterium]
MNRDSEQSSQNKALVRAAYDGVGATYYTTYLPTSLFSLEKRRRLELAVAWLQQAGSRRVLDVGCGPGVGVWQIAAGLPFSHIVGVDFAPTMLQFARTHYAQYGDYAVADAEQLPFTAGQFDGVVALGLLDKFERLAPVLAEVNRVLASGAPFIFTYPNANGVPSILRRTARRYLSQTTPPSSTRMMSLPALHRLLAQSGFCIDECRAITYGNGRWFFRWSAWQNRWLEAVAGGNVFGRIAANSTIWRVTKDDRSSTLV